MFKNKKNSKFDKEFKQFENEIINYLEKHPEFNDMVSYYGKNRNVVGIKWGADAFFAWKSGKLEWFMQHSQLEYEKQLL